jgi:hypothetical protein
MSETSGGVEIGGGIANNLNSLTGGWLFTLPLMGRVGTPFDKLRMTGWDDLL